MIARALAILRVLWRWMRAWRPLNRVLTGMGRVLIHWGVSPYFFLEHLPYLGPVQLSLSEGRKIHIRSYGDDYLLNSIFWRGVYEPESFPLFCQLAETSRGVLDIGAHIGTYALAAARVNPQAEVHAFEPLPEAYRRLVDNIRLNGLSNLKPHPWAVGKENKEAALRYDIHGPIPSNSTLRSGPHGSVGDTRAVQVHVISLDRMAAEEGLPPVDLVKIDTEGTEWDVFVGMAHLLARDRPIIFCEVLDKIGQPAQLEEILIPLGYHFFRLEPDGPKSLPHLETHPQWWNYLFITEHILKTRITDIRFTGKA